MGTELTDKTIAAEAGLVERTVSFTKGCYTGQELVARIESRGSNVARRLVGVVAPEGPPEGSRWRSGMTLHAGAAPPGDGAADDKVVGSVTSTAWSPELGAWAALGYLHRTVEAPGPVRVRSGEGVGARPAQVVNCSRWSFGRADGLTGSRGARTVRGGRSVLLGGPPTRWPPPRRPPPPGRPTW